jgi:hypothetical protein
MLARLAGEITTVDYNKKKHDAKGRTQPWQNAKVVG